MIQRIFSSSALAPTQFTIFIRVLSILAFSFVNKVDFSCQYGCYCVNMINKIIHRSVEELKSLFSCTTGAISFVS